MLEDDSEDENTAELTLPSVVASLGGSYRRECLLLTLVFHSDTARIGEVASLSPAPGGAAAVLGRSQPRFAAASAPGLLRPLGDRHVSRLALEIAWRGDTLLLKRGRSATRCQIDGQELQGEAPLTTEQLRRGVSILLGHAVVLLLSLGESPSDAGASRPDLPRPALVGSSSYSRQLRHQVLRAAETDLDILVRGETGTGKELVAEAVHSASRLPGPLVAVNMSAIPAALAPAALFGSARGAYTGADRAGTGYFQQAEGGTLFLDEVGDTPAEIQPQLLRALQEREIQVVGGPVRRVSLRVISATDAPLEGSGCEFRAALRHRLGSIEIPLLPLREHPEDIGELLWHFMHRELAALGREDLLPAEDGPPMVNAVWADLFHRCVRYSWPGNVRELLNWARQVALASEEQLTLPENLYASLERGMADDSRGKRRSTPPRSMDTVSEEEFFGACEAQAWEVAPVARQLGVSRTAVYRRIDATEGLCVATEVSVLELREALARRDGDLRQAASDLRVSASGLCSRARQLGLLPRRSGD